MDAQCRQLFLHAAETLHKPYAIVQIGKDYDWQHTPIGAVIGPQKVGSFSWLRISLNSCS